MSIERNRQDFVRATYHILLAFLLRLVRDRATAEDLTQATYERVFRHPDFDPSRIDAVGFLKQRARWLVQDHCRRSHQDWKALPAHLIDPRMISPDQSLEREEIRKW